MINKIFVLDFFIFLLAAPLSKLWGFIYWFRRKLYGVGFYHSLQFPVPVISVGNLAFGGSGKTPLTIWLAQFFETHQKKVNIAIRGYKGLLEKKKGCLKAPRPFAFDPVLYGDEAILLARSMKNGAVIIGKNRTENLLSYWDETQPDVIILDDGFQHLKINRDINIVLFDGNLPISRYKTAPRGFLREGISALNAADVVVITRSKMAGTSKISSIKKIITNHTHKTVPVFEVDYIAKGFLDCDFRPTFGLSELAGRKIIAVSGIASPKSFHDSIQESGGIILERIAFPDHHTYSASELLEIEQKAINSQAIIIVTEKDMVKIKNIFRSDRLYCLAIGLQFSGDQEKEFKKILENYVI